MTSSSLTPDSNSACASREHVADRARHQVAAQARDDAEGAAVVAALADLQVGVVLGRELDADRGSAPAPGRRTDRAASARARAPRPSPRSVACGPVTASTLGCICAHEVAAAVARLRAEAAGDDDLAVLGQRLADRVEALPHRVVDEAAGVDDHEVGAGEGLRGGVALGASWVRISSESVSAFGQPSETKPIFGAAAGRRPGRRPRVFVMRRFSPMRASRRSRRSAARRLSASALGRRSAPGRPGNSASACLVICSCICRNTFLRLLEIVAHQLLHHRRLAAQELGPHLGRCALGS